MSWNERGFEWGKGGGSLKPVVSGGSRDPKLGIISSVSLISPNAPLANLNYSFPLSPPTPIPLTLNSNFTKLEPDGITYWPSGDSLLFQFGSPWLPAQQLTIADNGANSWLAAVQFISALQTFVMGHYDNHTDSPSGSISLYLEPLTATWVPSTVTFNSQSLCDDTSTDSAGNYTGGPGNYPSVATLTGFFNTDSTTTDAVHTAIGNVQSYALISGIAIAGTTTTIKVDGYPFNSVGTQVRYNSQYNVAGNFIGSQVTITPYAGDLSGRVAQVVTVTGFAVDGTFTFTPALPWTPVTGAGGHYDTVAIIPPIYGFALRLNAATSPMLLSTGAQNAFRAKFQFNDISVLNFYPALGNC